MDEIEVQGPETEKKNKWYLDVTAQFRGGIFDDLESHR
jgi:hypothetical protein